MMLGVKVKCPYCGYEQYFETERNWGYTVQFCDNEEGGCGDAYVITYSARLTATAKRIEGEGEEGE